jgi:hypothetical protein
MSEYIQGVRIPDANVGPCRVMLGGEIYYRAIGRPWGPAADFIVKFHLLTTVGWAIMIDRRPGPPGSGWS